MKRLTTLCFLAACLSATGVFANADASPATTAAPATTPAVALDQSSPRALLRSFFASRGEVDEATLRSLLHAATPPEQKILDSLVQVEVANARLRGAERQKFGASSLTTTSSPGSSVASAPGLDVDTVEDIEALTEKVEGDRATLSSPMDATIKMELVRVDGKWKLPMAAQVGAIDATLTETLAVATRAQIEIIDAVAADVKAGKFANDDQVRQELSRRFAERLASATRPASQSATQPAGT
ncbi:MAG: hypothetical protein QOE14_1842 [Humisphaera sp.]|nr:hypothetical protein [Humisphaera sp.]